MLFFLALGRLYRISLDAFFRADRTIHPGTATMDEQALQILIDPNLVAKEEGLAGTANSNSIRSASTN